MSKKPHLVRVEWVDSTAHSGWRSKKDIEEAQLITCHSVGWLLHWGKDAVKLGATHDTKTDPEWNDCQSIPRSCVVRVRRLEEKKRHE